ncbi:hypothetical protein [Halalkalibacter urbisdiaboli]|uniref:hypothetical protein n=1 Tax=Halalkalibacter urbisdiaboli TaxID=1960589 RepID=UPI000B44DCC3|nr:hypothetical protein [Halalkalibacter urbisdiaboli]
MLKFRRMLVFLFLFTLLGCGETSMVELENGSSQSVEKGKATLDKQTAADLLTTFSDKLNLSVDDQMKVQEYATKDEFFQSFSNIASRECVEEYYGYLFTEEDDGLYLLASETPVWVNVEDDFALNEISSEHYVLVQNSSNELYGKYEISISFDYKDGHWLINTIESSF